MRWLRARDEAGLLLASRVVTMSKRLVTAGAPKVPAQIPAEVTKLASVTTAEVAVVEKLVQVKSEFWGRSLARLRVRETRDHEYGRV